MSEPVAISVRGVAKCYRVFEDQRSRLLHALWPSRTKGMQEVWALRGVGFDVRKGEAVALIGRNGSGKSTMLEIITGTLRPTCGSVHVNGRVSALLELGSGFNPEYTGRDNVILNGLLLGLERAQILGRFEEIAAFAGIGDVLDRPVKTYSSGMLMRLAFAVQVLCEPDILIIDEALSVGDFFFQQKCLGHIRALCEKGVTLLFVSHDMGTVRDLCQRALYLRAGELRFDGESLEAIRRFMGEGNLAAAPRGEGAAAGARSPGPGGRLAAIYRDALWHRAQRPAAGSGKILAVALYDGEGRPATAFRMGDRMRVSVAYLPAPGVTCNVAVSILNRYGQLCTLTGSTQLRLVQPSAANETTPVIFDLHLDMMLEAGNYSIVVTLGYETGPNRGELLDQPPPLGPISLAWNYEHEFAPFLGQFGLPAQGAFSLS